jgi:hypothetical protein
MDIESPKHLERFRDRPEIKAVLLRLQPSATTEARFERSARNVHYWPFIESLSARFLAAGQSAEIRQPIEVYGRSCWLIATTLGTPDKAPYAVAVTAADGVAPEVLIALLRDVSEDYWFGSSFFK